jgi:hypothetical protein
MWLPVNIWRQHGALTIAILLTGLIAVPSVAQESCHSRAIGRDGRPLHGAALNSFMAKCAREAKEQESRSPARQKLLL